MRRAYRKRRERKSVSLTMNRRMSTSAYMEHDMYTLDLEQMQVLYGGREQMLKEQSQEC